MSHFDEFVKTFKPRLHCALGYKQHQFDRWPAFNFIAKELFSKGSPVNIVETGTLRKDDDWLGYGHSTLLWDWILERTEGKGFSVDIDRQAIDFARSKCKHLTFIHEDSVGFLRGLSKEIFAKTIDLLYLDSFDWSKELHLSSCLHHMGELAMIYDQLPSGCLIAVDDAHNENEGKHVIVRNFFRDVSEA